MLLEPIYEQDFLDCSFGFRPARNAHQALQAVRTGIMEREEDGCSMSIYASTSTASIGPSCENSRRRVTDGVVRRLIDKWLKAGVLEDGQLSLSGGGDAGRVGLSHPVWPTFFCTMCWMNGLPTTSNPGCADRAPSCASRRLCDDLWLKDDADRVLEVLGKRMGKYGLQLHPDKTRLVDFRPTKKRASGEAALATTFNFLGFPHVWGKSRKGNRWSGSRRQKIDLREHSGLSTSSVDVFGTGLCATSIGN